MSTSYDIIFIYYSCLSRYFCFCFCFISNQRKKKATNSGRAHTPLNNFHFSSPNTWAPCALTRTLNIARTVCLSILHKHTHYKYRWMKCRKKTKPQQQQQQQHMYITGPKAHTTNNAERKKAKMAHSHCHYTSFCTLCTQSMTETETRLKYVN